MCSTMALSRLREREHTMNQLDAGKRRQARRWRFAGIGILGFLATALCSAGNVLFQVNIGAPRWLWVVPTVIGGVLFARFSSSGFPPFAKGGIRFASNRSPAAGRECNAVLFRVE